MQAVVAAAMMMNELIHSQYRAEEEHNEISKIAYHIWLPESCPHGKDKEHWLKAEQIYRQSWRQNDGQ